MPTFSLTQLQGLVYAGLDDNQLFYTPANVTSVLNEGLRRLNNLIGFNQDTVPTAGFTAAGQQIYLTPAGILVPMSVYFEGRELKKLSLRELTMQHRNWTMDLNTNLGQVARWAPIGITQFVIHPIDARGGSLLEVQGIVPMVPLVNGGDVVNLEDEWCQVLVDWCQGRIMIKEPGQTFAQSSACYQRMVSKAKGFVAFQGMVFPRYFIRKELDAGESRGS